MKRKYNHSSEWYRKNSERLDLYREFRNQGKTYQEIADMVGLSKKTVKAYCLKNGLGYSESERLKVMQESEGPFKPTVDWSRRVQGKTQGQAEFVRFERVSGGEVHVFVKCLTCRAETSVASSTLRHQKEWHCSNCKRLEKEKQDRLKRFDQEERKRQQEINKPRVQIAFRFCECGKLLTEPKRKVCDGCLKLHLKETWRRKEIKRRAREQEAICDSSISLKRLYERDNGVCYICGQVCDWNDSEWKHGTFVVGRKYPTIEHLKPLSKGGSHTWDNIKLACLSCNSKKYNREAV